MLRVLLPFLATVSISLTLSACASPLAPSAKPDNFYEAVRSDVEEFWADYFSSKLGRTYTPIARLQLFAEKPVGVHALCLEPPSRAFYCRPDRGVYLESQFMEAQLSKFGKFGPAMIIAHEIGHHTQNLLGLFDAPSLLRELQADCIAGGWVKDADARGLLEKGDYAEAWSNFIDLGSDPWFGRTHGTVQERQTFFQIGFVSGASSCSWS